MSRLVACAGHTLHVRLWSGDPARTVVIWHGVTGTSLDHLALAERLARLGHQVVAPDGLGCGASDWAKDPEQGYGLAVLSVMAGGVMDALDIRRAAWIGASKGGGLGLRFAAEAPERVTALVLCDVGVELPDAFRRALASRLGNAPTYNDMGAFRDHIERIVTRARLPGDPATIDRLTTAWSRRIEGGRVGYHYDPALSNPFLNNPEDFALWPQWSALRCPVLILRGEHSEVLPQDEVDRMLALNAGAQSVLLRGAGHLNFLDDPDHQDVLIRFLSTAHPVDQRA